jgi:hypothetical protein
MSDGACIIAKCYFCINRKIQFALLFHIQSEIKKIHIHFYNKDTKYLNIEHVFMF